MTSGVNLMTAGAQFRFAARRIARAWAMALGGLVVALAAIACWSWLERREVLREHEALEARYEPIRRLSAANRSLQAKASELLSSEKTVLQLARHRSALSLLAAVSSAIAETQGAAVIEHITVTSNPATAASVGAGGHITLEISSTLDLEATRLAKLLERDPLVAAKIVSSETTSRGGVDLRRHVIECEF